MSQKNGKFLLSKLFYEPTTGNIRWINNGNIATTKTKNGYLEVSAMENGIRYRMFAHRFAIMFMGKKLPEQVDHQDHDRTNNKWTNLKSSCKKHNAKNMSKTKANTSGVTGVVWDKRRNMWKAQIRFNEKVKFLGRFTDFSDAVNARKNAEVLYGYHENHGV